MRVQAHEIRNIRNDLHSVIRAIFQLNLDEPVANLTKSFDVKDYRPDFIIRQLFRDSY